MKYAVHLNLPISLSGRVQVEADNPTDAGVQAFELAGKGDLLFGHREINCADADISDVAGVMII